MSKPHNNLIELANSAGHLTVRQWFTFKLRRPNPPDLEYPDYGMIELSPATFERMLAASRVAMELDGSVVLTHTGSFGMYEETSNVLGPRLHKGKYRFESDSALRGIPPLVKVISHPDFGPADAEKVECVSIQVWSYGFNVCLDLAKHASEAHVHSRFINWNEIFDEQLLGRSMGAAPGSTVSEQLRVWADELTHGRVPVQAVIAGMREVATDLEPPADALS